MVVSKKRLVVALVIGLCGVSIDKAIAIHQDPCHVLPCPSIQADLVVKDSTGVNIGSFISVVTGISNSYMAMVQLVFQDTLGEDRYIPVCFTKFQLKSCAISGASVVHFSGLDCTGQAYISEFRVGKFFPPAIESSQIVADGSNPTVRALYVSSSSALTVQTTLSTARALGCSSPELETILVVPAERLVDNLHHIFPPPYTLENQ